MRAYIRVCVCVYVCALTLVWVWMCKHALVHGYTRGRHSETELLDGLMLQNVQKKECLVINFVKMKGSTMDIASRRINISMRTARYFVPN